MEYAQGPISTGKEYQTGGWIKRSVVDTRANGKVIDYLTGLSIHHNHLWLVPTTYKQTLRLCVVGETGWDFRHADGKALLDLERLRIKHHDLAGLFAVNINKTIGSDHRLFAVTLNFHGAYYVSSSGIDGADIVCTVIVGEDALCALVVVDAIRPFAYIDLLDQLERRRVEHRDLILTPIAGESVLESRGDRNPMDARCVGNCTDDFTGIGVHDVHLSSVRDVEPPRGVVQHNVIETANTGNRITADQLVGGTALHQKGGKREGD